VSAARTTFAERRAIVDIDEDGRTIGLF